MLDVVIVGGGPAGLATAIAASQLGLRVRVLDRRRPPIDKACGEGLMPDGVAALLALGVDLEPYGHRFQGIRYLDGETVADGSFPQVHGLGVRRLVLHRALVQRAEEVGVDLRWETPVDRLETSSDASFAEVATPGGLHRARWLVGADGLRSRIRRWAGLEGRSQPLVDRRFGVRRHLELQPWSSSVEVYWAEDCEAYVTPVAPDEVGVAILWNGRKARFDTLLPAFPQLEERIARACVVSADRGAGPLRQKAKSVVRGNLALVGDAAGYLDAITGEGLSLAFHQAHALAEALATGDLRPYQKQCRRITRLPTAITWLLLEIKKHPRARRRLIELLARDPELFSQLLAIHCRHRSPGRVAWDALQRLLGFKPEREPRHDPIRREG